MLLSSLVGGAVQGIGSLIGGIRANKQAKKAEKQINQQKEDNRKWYEQKNNTNYIDTSEAQAVLSKIRNENQKLTENNNNNVISRGVSDETKVALASSLNENYSQSVNNLAGLGTRYKDNLRHEFKSRDEKYNDMIYNATMGKAESAGMFGDVASGVGGMISANDPFNGKEINLFNRKKNETI